MVRAGAPGSLSSTTASSETAPLPRRHFVERATKTGHNSKRPSGWKDEFGGEFHAGGRYNSRPRLRGRGAGVAAWNSAIAAIHANDRLPQARALPPLEQPAQYAAHEWPAMPPPEEPLLLPPKIWRPIRWRPDDRTDEEADRVAEVIALSRAPGLASPSSPAARPVGGFALGGETRSRSASLARRAASRSAVMRAFSSSTALHGIELGLFGRGFFASAAAALPRPPGRQYLFGRSRSTAVLFADRRDRADDRALLFIERPDKQAARRLDQGPLHRLRRTIGTAQRDQGLADLQFGNRRLDIDVGVRAEGFGR